MLLIFRNYNIASTPIDPVIEETSEVQLVVPNATMVEAHNSLCRRVWNNNNSIKTKTRSKKVRRRVLNLAAAKIRWDKEVDKLNLDTAMSQKKEREKKRGLWYDTLLKNYGVEYAGGFEEHLSVNDEHDRLEEMDDTVIEGARLLTVLHDHGYAKGYVESVQTVVDNIRRVVLKSNVSGGDDGGMCINFVNTYPLMKLMGVCFVVYFLLFRLGKRKLITITVITYSFFLMFYI